MILIEKMRMETRELHVDLALEAINYEKERQAIVYKRA
jgi:hypothetical protein